jgi:uncharacterized protein
VSPQTAILTVRTPDGLHLVGSLVRPDGADQAAVLVHGGGMTREEGGFFARLATGLADAGIASLRFDVRGHGESEGRQEDLTIAGVLADIRAAVATCPVRGRCRSCRLARHKLQRWYLWLLRRPTPG